MPASIQQKFYEPHEAVDITSIALGRLTSALELHIGRYRTGDSADPVKPVMNELCNLFYIVDILIMGCKNVTFNYGANDRAVDIVTSNYFIKIYTGHCVFSGGKIRFPSMTIHRQV